MAGCRHLIALVFLIACVIAASQASVRSQTHTKSETLSPIARAVLADGIAKADRLKQRGPQRMFPHVSFPLPMCVFENGLCGAVNRDGSIAVAPKFDFVDEFHEGRAVVRLAGLYGYVDLKGRTVVEPQHALAGPYRLGLAEVDVGGKSALIDLEGKEVLAPRFAGAVPFTKSVFWVNDGVRDLGRMRPGREELQNASRSFLNSGNPFRANAKWGLIDASGNWVREPEFSDIWGFDPDNPELMWAMAGRQWGLIRPDGTWTLEPVYQRKGELSDGLAQIWQDNKVGFVDRTGRMVIPPKFGPNGTRDFADGMPAPAQLGNRVGLIDRSGSWVVEPKYDNIYAYSSEGGSNLELFRGFMGNRGRITDILDRTGKIFVGGMTPWRGSSTSRTTPSGGLQIMSVPGQYPMFCDDGRIIGFFDRKPQLFERDGMPLDPSQGELWWPLTCEPPYVVKIGDRFVHVDKWLRPLTAEKFDAVGLFRDGLAAIVIRRKYGLIRDDGTWAIEPRFDAAHPIERDRAIVTLDGRSGVYDVANDRWITQTRFDDICAQQHGVVGVMLDGKAGAIDASGAWVIQPKYDFTSGLTMTGLMPVRTGDKWALSISPATRPSRLASMRSVILIAA